MVNKMVIKVFLVGALLCMASSSLLADRTDYGTAGGTIHITGCVNKDDAVRDYTMGIVRFYLDSFTFVAKESGRMTISSLQVSGDQLSMAITVSPLEGGATSGFGSWENIPFVNSSIQAGYVDLHKGSEYTITLSYPAPLDGRAINGYYSFDLNLPGSSSIQPTLAVSPTSDSVAATGGNYTFEVAANQRNWAVWSSEDWLQLTGNGSGYGNQTVSYHVEANPSTVSRTATVTVASGDQYCMLTVTQLGASSPPPSPTLSISPTSANLSSSAQTKSFSVTCNSSWTVTKDSDWITLGTTKGTSSGAVSYSVSAHTKFVARTGYITVTSGTLSRRFEVNQEGYDDNVMVTFNGNGGTVYNLAGQAVGSSIQLAQTPGTKWRNLPDATNGSKTFDGWWTQSSGGTRITTSDTFSGTPTTVYAHWKTPVTPTLSISPTTGDDVDWGGGAGWFSVTCNSSWSVSTSDTWITLSTRSGSGNGTVYFSYGDNDSSSSRLGKITVTSGTLKQTYQFTQQRHFKKGPGGLDYFTCTDGNSDLGVRNLPFIAAGTYVVYGDGVGAIRFVPKTSGWQTIWLCSPSPSSASGYLLDRSGYLLVRLHDDQGGLGSLCECQKMSVYLTAGKPYSLTFAEERFNATRPSAGDAFAFELQVGGSAPQIAYLDAPTILSVSASEIRWSKVPEATEYSIYRYPKAWSEKTGASHYGDCIATVAASAGTCYGLTPAPGDRFYVRAANSKVTSWFSDGFRYDLPTYEIRFEDRGDILPMKTGRLAVINIPLMPSCVCEVGKVYALPECSFTPPVGKRFVGWACSNGRRYDDGMLVFNLAEPGETVTMTAIWE